jgi:micrococcal nuclease
MLKKSCVFIVLLVLAFAASSREDEVIFGKIVGVADGDTVTLLESRTQHTIRLFGIDTPERHQAFGKRAGLFTSERVFGKQVSVIRRDTDRYGRLVGIVYVDGVCLNEALLKNGLAWVYPAYCKIPICVEWTSLEAKARTDKLGLWSHPDPLPPWEFRRNRRKSRVQDDHGQAHRRNR